MSDPVVEQPSLEDLIKQSKRKANRSFWTAFVVIPVLLVSLLSAAPQWIDRFRAANAGVTGGSLAEAELQNSLWRKNAACLAGPSKGVDTENDLKVDAKVCPSGDVLIQVIRPDNKQFYKWVAVDSVAQIERSGDTIPVASAN